MTLNVGKEVAALKRMTVKQLRGRHIEVFGEPTRSGHKDYLVKRIAWRLQAQEMGDLPSRAVAASAGVGLSRRARRRADQLANDADLRSTAPKVKADDGQSGITTQAAVAFDHDPRIPMPGSIITRHYKGREIAVKVRPKGFEFEGEVYRSLSAVAKAVTGKHWNGYHFFKLRPNGDADE